MDSITGRSQLSERSHRRHGFVQLSVAFILMWVGTWTTLTSAQANTIADITWTLGPDHPTYRKGGATGIVDGMLVSAGGVEFPIGCN